MDIKKWQPILLHTVSFFISSLVFALDPSLRITVCSLNGLGGIANENLPNTGNLEPGQ